MNCDHDEAMTEARFRTWREHEGDDCGSAWDMPAWHWSVDWVIGALICAVVWCAAQ